MVRDLITRRRLMKVSGAGLVAGSSGLVAGCAGIEDIGFDPLGREDRRPIEGGIGGTGIVGLLTEFSSLIINGIKVETTATTQYSNAFGSILKRDVDIGNSLTVEALNGSNGVRAQRVHVTHPLIGRVQSVATDGRSLEVNGILVLLENQALGRAKMGDWIRISGVWSGQAVIASQVELAPESLNVVAGEVKRTKDSIFIGGVEIIKPSYGTILRSGQFATALGRFEGNLLNTSRIIPGRFIGAAGPLQQLSIEGYLDRTRTAPGFKVSGLGHSFSQGLQLSQFSGERTLFEGDYSGKFEASRGLILPQAFDDRRMALQGRRQNPANEAWVKIS